MELLVTLLIVFAVLAIIWWALSQMPLPQPLRLVGVVIFALVAIILLLRLAPHAVI